MGQSNHTTQRKIGKTLLVYLGSAWVFIEAINFLIDKYHWDTEVLDIIILLVIFGLPASVIYAWFYQRFTRKAIFLHLLNGLVAISVISYDLINPDSIDPTQLRLLRFQDDQKELAKTIRSIAILPFANYTGDSSQVYLVSGMHDALIGELGQIGTIRVISKTSTLQYANSQKTIKEIASELNVDAIIEASVLSTSDNIRVQLKLINAFPEEQQLWSQTFDSDMSNILNFYSRVIKNIANEIQLTLSPEQQTRLDKKRQVNPEAYEAYLKGKYSIGLLTKEGIEAAMGYFQKAIEIDPEYAPAHAGLGGIWAVLKQMDFVSPDEADPKIQEHLAKALAIDSTLAEVYYWNAIKKVGTDFNWEGGEQAFLKSLELSPNFSECRALFSHLLMCLSRWDESKVQMMQALKNDPNNPFIKVLHLVLLLNSEEYDSVIVKAIPEQKTMPTNPLVNLVLLVSYTQTEQYDLAIEQVKLKVELEADTSLSAYIEDLYKEKGFKEAMNETAKTLESLDGVYVSATTYQMFYAMAGNKDKFLDWIEMGYIRRDPDMPYIAIIPVFKPYRNEPRFIEIVKRMNLTFDKLE